MKIYLAARYLRRLEILGYANELEDAGHAVTSRWLQGNEPPPGLSVDEQERIATRVAIEDMEDLQAAECCIAFTESGIVTNGSRGGRHVELGMALALQKLTVVVGHRENVFCSLPQVVFMPSWEDCKAWLSEIHAVAGLS